MSTFYIDVLCLYVIAVKSLRLSKRVGRMLKNTSITENTAVYGNEVSLIFNLNAVTKKKKSIGLSLTPKTFDCFSCEGKPLVK